MEFVFESWVANGAPYHFVIQSWIDLLFFTSIFWDLLGVPFMHGIVYNFYVYLILIVYLTTFFDGVVNSVIWILVWYGGFGFFNFLSLFLFFSFVAISLYFIDSVFKVPVAGLVLLSREFLALEDEDLWISSNIFYMDMQIKKAKDFVVPLKVKEIEAFMTLTRLFFDEPLRDLQYNVFSNELSEFRHFQRKGFVQRKRMRELIRGLTPKRKFTRFKKHKRGGAIRALVESQQDQFLDKTSLTFSQFALEKRFYKFLTRNLKFYYLRPPVERKRLKRAILFKNRIKKQRTLSLRFKDRANFSQKFNSVRGLNLTTNQLLPSINESAIYMQPQILRNDFVKPYLIPRVNLKDFIFGTGYDKAPYSQSVKIPRFRRFLWFSLPFYLSEVSSRSAVIYSLTSLRRFLLIAGNWSRSKFLSPFFAIFEDSWAMGQFRIRNYSPKQMSLWQFLKLNNLSFVPFGDNPEDTDDSSPTSGVGLVQQSQNLLTDEASSSKLTSKFKRGKVKKEQNQSKTKKTRSEKNAKSPGSKKEKKENEKVKQKKRLKKKAYRKRLKRKRGTTRKNFLISRQRYHFSNISNVAGLYGPELRLLHLYKLLEYFYFVLTNDADFYEVAMFSAKVASLRDKYGQAIVADLLERADHKQALKVSVIMHVSDVTETIDATDAVKNIEIPSPITPGDIHTNLFTDTIDLSSSLSSPGGARSRHGFRTNMIKTSPSVANFSRDLILSHRYRVRF
jgi:hypothetical protein